MRRMGVLGPRQLGGALVEEGCGGCGQGMLRREEGGRESGLEVWELLDWVLRRDTMLLLLFLGVSFSGSAWFGVLGEVGRGQMVGVGLSKIVLRRFGWMLDILRELLGFRVGVSTSKSGLLSSSR